MKTFLSLVLLSCLTITAQAEPTKLPKDVVGLSYLTNGKIIAIKDVTQKPPSSCGRPNGPACMPPMPMKELTILYTLPGCMDQLGAVKTGELTNNSPVARDLVAVSAVAIHTEASRRTRCIVAHTETAKVRVPGFANYATELVQLNSSIEDSLFADLPKLPESLSHSEDIEVIDVSVKGLCAPGRICTLGPVFTEITLEVFKGSCLNRAMPIATHSNLTMNFNRSQLDLLVDAPIVMAKRSPNARCMPESTINKHKVTVPGVVTPEMINIVKLQ